MFEGEIIKVEEDFLGKSVYVKHSLRGDAGEVLFTIYGHTKPCEDIGEGAFLREGHVLGTASGVKGRETKLLPHLHLSVAWVPDAFPYERLDWQAVGDREIVKLLDPLQLLRCKYSILPGAWEG